MFGALEAALRNPDVAIDAIVDIVRVDPSLAVRVIRVSNSPVFRRGEAVESLDLAISRIGLREIHRLVGATVADQLFAVGLPLYRILGDDLWLNAVVTALAAEQIAMAMGRDGREAYTLGLLRNSGRMLLQRLGQDEALPPTAGAKDSAAETRAWEQETFGLTADEAGARLLQLWEFAPATVRGLRFAWSPLSDAGRHLEAGILHLAGWIADELGQGLRIETGQWTVGESILKLVGLDRKRVQEAVYPTKDAVNRTLDMLKPGSRL